MHRTVLFVRELAERPVVGCGCCVVPAAAAIERTLCEWRGVAAVEVDEKHGRVTVALAAAERPSNADLVWSLRCSASRRPWRKPPSVSICSDITIRRYVRGDAGVGP